MSALFGTKARTPDDVIRVTVGRNSAPVSWLSQSERPTMEQVGKRCGRWVERCLKINAQVSASVVPRLYAIDNAEGVIAKSRKMKPRPVDVFTKARFAGRHGMPIGSRASKALQGNLDNLVEVTDHPALDMLNDVNPYTEGYSFRQFAYFDLQLFGRLFWVLVGDGVDSGGPPEQLWRLRPQLTKVLRDPVNFVGGYEYRNGTEKKTFTPEEVFWLKQLDPWDDWGGLGWVEAWLKTIDADFSVVDFQDWIFKRGGMPDFVVKGGPTTDAQRRQFRFNFRKLFGNMRNREENLGFIGKDDEIVELSHRPKDMEYIQARNITRDEICAASGVPKSYVTNDDVNRSTAAEGDPTHIKITIWPLVTLLEDALNQRLLPRWSDRLILIHENPLREDIAVTIQNRESKLRSGYSVNETRLDEGKETLKDPNADISLIGAGLSTLDRVVNPPEPIDPFGGAFGGGGKDDDKPKGDEEKAAPVHECKHSHAMVSQKALWNTTTKDDRLTARARALGEAAFAAALRTVLLEQAKALQAAVASMGETISIEAAMEFVSTPEWSSRLAEVAAPFVERAVLRGGIAGLAKYGLEVDFTAANPRVQEFVNTYTVRLAETMQETTRVQLRDLLGEGLTNGETTAELAKRIREFDSSVNGYRSEMIARTESARAFERGQEVAWKESGEVEGKTWLLAPGACEFCEAAAAEYATKAVPLGVPFYSQGTVLKGTQGGTMTLDYEAVEGPPLHPFCRCDLLPVLREA